MDRATLTAAYLADVRSRGATAPELLGRQAESRLVTTQFGSDFLSRPLFLGHDEKTRLMADLELFRTALLSLPQRLFDGDVAAFARAAGLAEPQVAAVARASDASDAPGAAVSRLSRFDLSVEESGFRLLEVNMGSSLGGLAIVDIARAQLEHPLLADFAARHGLGHEDTISAFLDTMYAETGFTRADAPAVAVIDWPSSYRAQMAPFLHEFCAVLRERGVDATAGHFGQLDVGDRDVRLHGRKVDVIVRIFISEDLVESPDAAELMAPVLDAAADGRVRLFTPLDAELYASKAALAMLSDERHRSLYDADELAALDRLLPWTRAVRREKVTLDDGTRADLVDHALAHRGEFALKPVFQHGGAGVLLGWDDGVDDARWRGALEAAVDGPYVLQRRVRPVQELFPDDSGDLVPWRTVWGVFTSVHGFAGILARGVRPGSGTDVVNVANGASSGVGLHELAPGDRTAPGGAPDGERVRPAR
ncbi:hypothetical protein [Streptomyces sp. NPDC047928]|uniref:hypothetical protein n=1 Tax=unclassified Streptomyces TaxID=2593676 RepID=UPI0037142A7E